VKRETLLKIIKFLMRVLTRVEFEGLENIPAEGGVIFATNHMSRLDIPLLLINPRRTDLTALVADKYQRYWLFKFIVNTGGGVWLDRSKADFGAFREAARILKEGRPLGIAPEGTRSNIGQLLEGKAGTALLAYRTGAPVIPIAITGTEHGVRDILLLRRPRLKASFGSPIIIEPFERDQREAALQRYTDEIMCRIAAMMPEKYWGFYAGHPRLKELLEAKAG
jgi:1-acyl-sn-glycerol-3-phosphate acyltransferase